MSDSIHHTLDSPATQLSFRTPPMCWVAAQPSGLPAGLRLAFVGLALLALASPTLGLSQLGNMYNEFSRRQEQVTCMELIPSSISQQ